MTYEIRENKTYNSREIYFDRKPGEPVRDALKALKMRWNGVKRCWYGYATESELVAAILGNTAEEEKIGTAVVTDGYMGGGAVYGGNSDKLLYGASLSAAIREALKAEGLRGVTVRAGKSTYTDSLCFTVKVTPEDLTPREEFISAYEVSPSFRRISYLDGETVESVPDEVFYSLPTAERGRIRQGAAELEYRREALTECDINQYHIEKYTCFTAAFLEKLRKINRIILSFRYDESNSMVDYFNTNFYYTIRTKPGK